MGVFKKRISAENLFFVIGVVALVVMVYKIGIFPIVDNIKQTGWWFLPILLVWAVAYLLNTTSAMLIIRDGSPESSNIKFLNLYKITISTFAYNAATPVGLAGGEPYKIMELKKYIGTENATSSVILFSMMHIVAHFSFWMFSILLAIFYIPMSGKWIAALSVTFGICLLLVYVFFLGYRKGLVSNVLNILTKIPFLKGKIGKIREEKQDSIQLIDKQIASLHGERKRRFYLSLGIEFFSRVFTCSEIYFMFLAFGHPVGFLDCILIMAFTSLFANILFFTPLQLGSREGGFLLSFAWLGLASTWAISISLITRIREALWMLVGLLLAKITIRDGSRLLETNEN